MTKKTYRFPLTGKVKTKFPPDGFRDNPLEPINIIEYYYREVEPNLPQYFGPEALQYTYTVINYDLDNNFAEVIIEAEQHLFDWLDTQKIKSEKELYYMTGKSKLDLSEAKEKADNVVEKSKTK